MLKTTAALVVAAVVTSTEIVSAAPDPASAPASPAYLERAALYWMSLPDCARRPQVCADFERREGETVADVQQRIHDVAVQVAAGHSRRRGVLLMSLAFNESRFRGYVDDTRCNNVAWRQGLGARIVRMGDCDSGHAYSLWQIHPLTAEETTDYLAALPKGDRAAAIERADSIVSASLARDGTLRGYTGETDAAAPKAFRRLRMAEDYLLAHPTE